MAKNRLVNLGAQNKKSLADACAQDKGLPGSIMDNPPDVFCDDNGTRDDGWLTDISNKKVGIGEQRLCDPMQTGQIVNDVEKPNRNVVYRYSKALRGCDEAVMDLFRNVVVLDEDGKAHPVPIIWATQEKAVAAVLQQNVRKDNSLVVDRIKLPMLAIYSNSFDFNQDRYIYHRATDYLRSLRTDGKPGFTVNEKYERDTVFGISRGIPVDVGYTLYGWTLYVEDMNQLLEQILTKFSPIAYIRVRGVAWETGVKIDSIANNAEIEPGDENIRVIKFEVNMTAETYIPQPIRRNKAVLKTKIDIYDNLNVKEISESIDRLEVAVDDWTP
jgi:hypothetical protein